MAENGIFDALEWLAAMCPHVRNKGEQMVRRIIRSFKKGVGPDDSENL